MGEQRVALRGGPGPGELRVQVLEVRVGMESVGFGRLEQAVQIRAGAGPRGVLANSQFLRPTTKGRIAFSTALVSRGMRPWSKNCTNLGHCAAR